MHEDNYYQIQGWMITEAGLKGTELLVYALIYSFTQGLGGESFHGSYNFIAEMTGCTRRQAINCIKSLEEKHYIFVYGKNREVNKIKTSGRGTINALKNKDIHMVK